MRWITATLCLTSAMLLGSLASAVASSEYEKPVIIRGGETDTSLTVELSKDGKKFRATIEIESNKSKPCLGTIRLDGKIKSEECVIPTLNAAVSEFSGRFPKFTFNEIGECLGTSHPTTCNGIDTQFSFKYPHSIKMKVIELARQKSMITADSETSFHSMNHLKNNWIDRKKIKELHYKLEDGRIQKLKISNITDSKIGFDNFTEWLANFADTGMNPYSPGHGNLDTKIVSKIPEKFLSSGVGNTLKYKLQEEWNDFYGMLWEIHVKILNSGIVKFRKTNIEAVVLDLRGKSVEQNGFNYSSWHKEGVTFKEIKIIDKQSMILLKSERIWENRTSYSPNNRNQIQVLDKIKYRDGTVLSWTELAQVLRNKESLKIEVARKEKKRRELAKKAAEEKKRRELAKKAAEEKKRKAIEQQASEKSTSPKIGGSGALEQQLAILKKLHSNGLIDDQEFKTKKEYLLSRFLGLNTEPPTKVASAAKPHISARKKVLERYSDVKFGNYHALVIGSNNYKHLPKLTTAETDAQSVAKTLKNKYAFKVKTLINPKRQDILDQFDDYREQLTGNDNLLIYYAGHGYLDEQTNRGYWMPVDARPNRRSAWLANAAITATLKGLKANHVMVVSDSCYSGTLTRGLVIKKKTPDYVREVVSKKARVVITSGGLEPVEDKSGGKNSPFASVFLDVLNSNEGVLDGTQMFNKMRRPVMLKTEQTPAYSDVRRAGHEGGDFLFVRRR